MTREEAKRIAQGLITDFKCESQTMVEFCNVVIEALEQKSKTGYWIFVDKAHEHAHCSECDYGDVDLMDGRPHNYCPNCGAKMVEPQESEG